MQSDHLLFVNEPGVQALAAHNVGWDLCVLKSQAHRSPHGFFNPSVLDDLTERHLDFLQGLYGLHRNDRYALWRDVFWDIDKDYAEGVKRAKRGQGRVWDYISSAEAERDWERAAELASGEDEEYAEVARSHMLVGELGTIVKSVPLAPVFLMAAYAKLKELEKPASMHIREQERKRLNMLRQKGKRLSEALEPFLEALAADLARQRELERQALEDDCDPDKLPSATVGSEVGAWLRVTTLGTTLSDIVRDDPSLHRYLKDNHSDLHSKLSSRDCLSVGDLFSLLVPVIKHHTTMEVEAGQEVGGLLAEGLPSRRSPGKRVSVEDIPTDYSHLAFEGVLRLTREVGMTGEAKVAQEVCDLWRLLVTHEKHKDWRQRRRGKIALSRMGG